MLSIRPASRNAEGNTHRQPFKTPSRALAENRLGTVKGKGKAGAGQTPFQSKTPFQKPLFVEADIQLKGGVHIPARPFLDKTPFPNRIVDSSNINLQQIPFLHPASTSGTPDSALRPSSTRRHIRVPRNSQKFQTPLNTKIHWNVNDDSADGISLVLPEPEKVAALPEDDFDEIEYMPPNTLDIPYQPPFDLEMPDYKVLGKALLEASRNGTFYEPEPRVEFELSPEVIEMCDVHLDFSSIPDEDPFFEMPRKKDVNTSLSKSKPSSGLANARPIPVPSKTSLASRAGAPGFPSSGSRSTFAVNKISRPGTSTSVRPLSRPLSQAAAFSTSNSKTTVARPITRVPSVASKSTVLPRDQTRPITATATTLSRSKSTTAALRPHPVHADIRSTSSAAVSVYSKPGPKSTGTILANKPASTMIQRPASSVRPKANGSMTAAATKPATNAKEAPQITELGGSIVSLDDVEASLADDFMFDV
ncbi:hypothetical protein GGU10DRAFT_343182 [Lentinula aff. detonsa]|uniref:Uncharacterized protein n=1 Tax=Lentinula aff. detonsa TaxID=2804958 RepID=A0AA38NR47_9AGAR|nr:hypothetical protein GGU10DRAFT_343182 [Lentinula aff. detonsa]